MKVYCKRTYFEKNTNAFPVNGKEYGQDYVKWAWGKIYESQKPKDYEKQAGKMILGTDIAVKSRALQLLGVSNGS